MGKQADEVSAREAADILGASVETVYHYARTGRLAARIEPRALAGRRLWFKRAEVEALKRQAA